MSGLLCVQGKGNAVSGSVRYQNGYLNIWSDTETGKIAGRQGETICG